MFCASLFFFFYFFLYMICALWCYVLACFVVNMSVVVFLYGVCLFLVRYGGMESLIYFDVN